jgi:rhodanese-related sulfurtransferase
MENPLQPAMHLSATEWNQKLDEVDSPDSALLLDVRNVYESRVGFFQHPTTPTLLTNTRKYSDLPQLLASNPHLQHRQKIFMYCTGGVRCERVSMLVRELYPDKEVYQLQGGIQTYLHQFSDKVKQDGVVNNDGEGLQTQRYFVGKNFVSAELSYLKQSIIVYFTDLMSNQFYDFLQPSSHSLAFTFQLSAGI